jgi:hypothetical protein
MGRKKRKNVWTRAVRGSGKGSIIIIKKRYLCEGTAQIKRGGESRGRIRKNIGGDMEGGKVSGQEGEFSRLEREGGRGGGGDGGGGRVKVSK